MEKKDDGDLQERELKSEIVDLRAEDTKYIVYYPKQ